MKPDVLLKLPEVLLSKHPGNRILSVNDAKINFCLRTISKYYNLPCIAELADIQEETCQDVGEQSRQEYIHILENWTEKDETEKNNH